MTQEQIAYLQSIGADMNQFNSLADPPLGDSVINSAETAAGSSINSANLNQPYNNGIEAAQVGPLNDPLPVITPPDIPQVGGASLENPPSQAIPSILGPPSEIDATIPKSNEFGYGEDESMMINLQEQAKIAYDPPSKQIPTMDGPPSNSANVALTNASDMAIANASEAADVSFSGEKQVPPTENKKMGGLKGLFYNKTQDGADIAGQTAVDVANTSIESGMTQKKKGSEAFGKTLKSTGNPLMAGIVATATTVGGHAANISAKRQQVRNQEQAKFAMERAEMASIYNDPNSVYYRGPKGYLA